MPRKKKALCYLRVSHKDMNIESQRAELTKYCDDNNLSPLWYEEKHTGSTMDRPVFDKLLEDVRSGLGKTVVVTEVSRIGRTMVDAMNVIQEWLNKDIKLVVTSMQISFEGAVGKMIAAMLLGISEIELEWKKDRQRRGIELAKQDPSKYKGRPADTFTVDIKKILKYRSEGLAYSKIAKLLDITEMTVIRHFERVVCMDLEEALNVYADEEGLTEEFDIKYKFKDGIGGHYGDSPITSEEIKPLLKAALRIHKTYSTSMTTYKQKLKSLCRAWHEHYMAISEENVGEVDFRDLIAEAEVE